MWPVGRLAVEDRAIGDVPGRNAAHRNTCRSDLPLPMRLLIVSIAIVAILLSGCATKGGYDDETADWTAEHLYNEASDQLKNGNYDRAIELYEKLEGRFPYGQYADQARLEIAFAHYKNNEPESAILAADRFIKLNPRHPNVDYAYYLRGLAAFGEGQSFIRKMFKQDPTERDPKAARQAFQYFDELVTRFPKSRYAADSVQRMIYLRNRLAAYEIHVADYYMRRGAYVAAVNRAKYVVENYQRTPAVADALAVMVKGYRKMKMPQLAADALRVLKQNYPDYQELLRVETQQ